jgi:hypothetical protein
VLDPDNASSARSVLLIDLGSINESLQYCTRIDSLELPCTAYGKGPRGGLYEYVYMLMCGSAVLLYVVGFMIGLVPTFNGWNMSHM